MKVALTPAAQNDVQQAFLWYRRQGIRLGIEYKSDLEASLRRVGRSPFAYASIYGEIRRVLLRRFPYGILYEVTHRAIVVIGVLHTHRDPVVWQSRVGGQSPS